MGIFLIILVISLVIGFIAYAVNEADLVGGSIVGLSPETTYDIKLTLLGDPFTSEESEFTTWSETFPEGASTGVTDTNTMLIISTSGTAEAYLVWEAAGATATIDVNNGANNCINVAANVHHVIIRGLTLKDATQHGIRLESGVHDIVIEDCDISNWGELDKAVGGENMGVD